MQPLNSIEPFDKRMQFDKQLSKAYVSLKQTYEHCIASGFKILPDNNGGYRLFNNTWKVLKYVLKRPRAFPVGPIDAVPLELQNEGSGLSVMCDESQQDELVLFDSFCKSLFFSEF